MSKRRRSYGRLAWMTAVGLLLFVGCVPGLAPTATPPPTPTGTPTPLPTAAPVRTAAPLPTATPTLPPGYEVTAWPADDQPALDGVQTVYARLTRDGVGVAGASMYIVAHYLKDERRYPAQGYATTRADGIASVSFVVFDSGAVYPVSVDVYLSDGDVTVQGSTSYTPTC